MNERIDQTAASTGMGRRSFLKLTGAIGASVALSSLIAACGDDDDEPTPTGQDAGTGGETETETDAETPETTETETDDTSDSESEGEATEFIMAITPDPLSMSPWAPSSVPAYALLGHVYETTLFRGEDMDVVPVLAESWEQVEPDLLQLNLRQGVKFHDGEDFTSAAVKFSLETIIAPDSGSVHKPPLSMISEVETPDDYTVLIRTDEPNRALLRNLTLATIMTEKFYNEIDGNWATNAIGTGPYKFVEYLPGERVVLERNEDYWGEQPERDRLVFRIITETGTRLSALQAGEVSLVNNVPPDQVGGLESNDELQVLSLPTARAVFCGLRIDRPVFEDIRVRQAVNYAINKEEIVNGLFAGLAEVATGPLASMVYAANTDLEPWPYDPDMARQLLEESGNPNPRIVYGTANGRYINDRQVSEAIAGYLTEVGFEVDFHAPEWGAYYQEVFSKEESRFDMFLLAWGVTSMEPDFLLRDFFHSDFADWTAYNNPRVDELLDEAAQTFEDDKVRELLWEAQEIIRDDCSWAWLYHQPEIHAASANLTGYAPRPDEFIILNNVRLDGE